jgi:hypothetical protein
VASAKALRARLEHELKLHLMVSADCEPTSALRIRRSSESSAMDCHDSKLNGTVFGTHDWPYHLRGQAAMYRKLAEQTDDPTVKNELLVGFVYVTSADPSRRSTCFPIRHHLERVARRGGAISHRW